MATIDVPHNGLQQPFDHGMCSAIIGRAYVGSERATPADWADRAKSLALENVEMRRELTIARVLDSDEWAAWQANQPAGMESAPMSGHYWARDTAEEIEEIRRLAIVACMEGC